MQEIKLFDWLARRSTRGFLRKLNKVVDKINALEPEIGRLTDDQLRDSAQDIAKMLRAISDEERKRSQMTEQLPRVFGLVREAARRNLQMRHYDCQLVGGMTLHEGMVAEMKTGEGKTLVASLPLVLNALAGHKSYLVTVNDYLAKRDAEWMGGIYRALGLTVGTITGSEDFEQKQSAYGCDIIYCTNSELGFDYLRDRMAIDAQAQVQAALNFAIVDEADSILIDEARTPLIISGAMEDKSQLYRAVTQIVPKLQQQDYIDEVKSPLLDLQEEEPRAVGDFWVDEKERAAELTEQGYERAEQLLKQKGVLDESDSLYASANLNLIQVIHTCLRARYLYQRDVNYLVRAGEVILIDEHTGRALPGRRLSQGLHQAIECKEKVAIQPESQTLASTTYQNFFRMFGKVAGMTGTAMTDAAEFQQIYNMSVVAIPTHKPMVREDEDDLVFMTAQEKFEAAVDEIEYARELGYPILVGTASVESSEYLSGMLMKRKIPHSVLNAKNHTKEAEIVADAGRKGCVTIATNMAGRGTDIVLGGNWRQRAERLKNPSAEQLEELEKQWQKEHDEVVEIGGLYVLGTERHESRRIDDQLRGRSGRQGDPGRSQFLLSMEDDLIRLFASERIVKMMQFAGYEKGEAISHSMLSGAVERAQKKVEERNFEVRKHLLEYDNVANEQRHIIYAQRDEVLSSGDEIHELIDSMRDDVVQVGLTEFYDDTSIPAEWPLSDIEALLQAEWNLTLNLEQIIKENDIQRGVQLTETVVDLAQKAYHEKWSPVEETARRVERQVLVQTIDRNWQSHLQTMEELRSSINLRAYAQRNPKQEYKREAFHMFQETLAQIRKEATSFLMRLQVREQTAQEQLERSQAERAQRLTQVQTEQPAEPTPDAPPAPVPVQQRVNTEKVGRNDPCPCGCGRKYKHHLGKDIA